MVGLVPLLHLLNRPLPCPTPQTHTLAPIHLIELVLALGLLLQVPRQVVEHSPAPSPVGIEAFGPCPAISASATTCKRRGAGENDGRSTHTPQPGGLRVGHQLLAHGLVWLTA